LIRHGPHHAIHCQTRDIVCVWILARARALSRVGYATEQSHHPSQASELLLKRTTESSDLEDFQYFDVGDIKRFLDGIEPTILGSRAERAKYYANQLITGQLLEALAYGSDRQQLQQLLIRNHPFRV
jgi:hypothetical protein